MTSQRTIETVLNLQTGELLEAADLFLAPDQRESEIFQLRNSLERDRQQQNATYVCIYCKHPVGIRGRKDRKHFYFAHCKDGQDCHIKTSSVLSREQIQCIKYNGVKESDQHQFLKGQLAYLLEQDEQVLKVDVEEVYRNLAISNSWKKPDILAHLSDKTIAVELQLSTTFLSVIVSRALFYQQHGIYLLWIFPDFSIENELQKFTQKDVYYSNAFHVYVFDREAQQHSLEQNRLLVKCFYKSYIVSKGRVCEKWEYALISIHELKFSATSYSFFYHDSQLEKSACELLLAEQQKLEKQAQERFDAEEKASSVIAYLRRLYQSQLMIAPEPWEYGAGSCKSPLEIKTLNEKLGFNAAKSGVIAKVFLGHDKQPFLNYICSQDAIQVDFSGMTINGETVFDQLLHVESQYEFLRKITLLFRKGYQLNYRDLASHEHLYGSNYWNHSESERNYVERWAYVYALNGLFDRKDVFALQDLRQVAFALLSLKHDLSIGYKYSNLRQYAIHFLTYQSQYGKLFIRAMQQYGQYSKLLKEDKSGKLSATLDKFVMRHPAQITGDNYLFLQIFPELDSVSGFLQI